MAVISLKTVSLDTSLLIAQKALEAAQQHKFLPLAVTVLDIRGEVKVHLAQEGTSLYRFKIATGKARGALGLGFGNRELQRRAEKAPFFIHAVQHLSEGDMVPVPIAVHTPVRPPRRVRTKQPPPRPAGPGPGASHQWA